MNGWSGAVDDECAAAGEGITAVNGGESESGVVACGVLDGAAVEGEGGGGFVVEIGGGIAVLDGVCKRESAGAGSRGVVDDLIGGSGFEGELRRAPVVLTVTASEKTTLMVMVSPAL